MTDFNDPFFWSGIDDNETLRKQQSEIFIEQQLNLSNQFAKCFNSEAGKTVLEHLESMTLHVPSWVPEYGNSMELVMRREGQNSLIRYIKARIAESEDAYKKD